MREIQWKDVRGKGPKSHVPRSWTLIIYIVITCIQQLKYDRELHDLYIYIWLSGSPTIRIHGSIAGDRKLEFWFYIIITGNATIEKRKSCIIPWCQDPDRLKWLPSSKKVPDFGGPTIENSMHDVKARTNCMRACINIYNQKRFLYNFQGPQFKSS